MPLRRRTRPADSTMADISPRSPGELSGTTYMVVATFIAAVGAYLFQLIVGRALGPDGFAPVGVIWTIQFLVFTTVFLPMEQLTVRRLSYSTQLAAPWALFLATIAAVLVGSVLFAALTLERLLADDWAFLPVVAAVIAAYGAFALGRGYLAGRRRFKEYGICTFAESALRLALASALVIAGVGALGVSWTLVAGALVVWLWHPMRGERRVQTAPRERDVAGSLATFVTANAASQTILAAGPLVVAGLGAGSTEVSIFFETFLLFRAPLTVAYNLISRVLPPLTRFVEQGREQTLRLLAISSLAGAAATAAAGYAFGYFAGPQLVQLLLGAEFRPPARLAALAASGVVLATFALFVQQILVAMRATGRLAAAWLVGLAAAAVTIAAASGSASMQVGWAFFAGEATAFVLLVAATLAGGGRPANERQTPR